MIDFRILTFLELCKQKSYTKTAQALSITQPTVTQHIQYLERLYKVRLFEYEGKKLMLSNEGEFLYQKAVTMLSDSTQILSRIQHLPQQKQPLYIGATLTIGEFLFPPIFLKYLQNHPETDLSLAIHNTKILLEMLKSSDINCALIEGYFDKRKYDYQLIRNEDFICVCGPTYPFEKFPTHLDDIFSCPLILREQGSGTREVLERVLSERSLNTDFFNSNIPVNNLNVIKYLCTQNVGITFLYRSAVKRELEDGSLIELKLKDFNIQHEFNFVTLKGSIFKDDYTLLYQYLTN